MIIGVIHSFGQYLRRTVLAQNHHFEFGVRLGIFRLDVSKSQRLLSAMTEAAGRYGTDAFAICEHRFGTVTIGILALDTQVSTNPGYHAR